MKMSKIILLLLFLSSPLFATAISFSSGYSKANLREGQKSLVLSEKATVKMDQITISSHEMRLEGEAYERVTCQGDVFLRDEENDISMRTSRLFFDRNQNELIISTWCEMTDQKNQLEASAASLSFDLDQKILTLSMRVSLVIQVDDGYLVGKAERVVFDQESHLITFAGRATIDFDGNHYQAQLIEFNTETKAIHLDGQIEGVLYG